MLWWGLLINEVVVEFFCSGYFQSCQIVYDLFIVEKVKKSPSDFLKKYYRIIARYASAHIL